MNYLWATLAGLLLILSQPKISLYPLVFVGLLPLLVAVKRNPAQALSLGTWAGFVYFYGLLYWLIRVMTHFGGLPWLAAAGVLALLALYLGLYWGLALALAKRLIGFSPALESALAWAAFFTLADYLRAYFLGGFPWGFLGQALAPFKAFIQVADLGGVYLVSFLVYLCNYAVFVGLVFRRAAWPTLFFTSTLLVFCLGYGYSWQSSGHI